jgi:hypothetical protein
VRRLLDLTRERPGLANRFRALGFMVMTDEHRPFGEGWVAMAGWFDGEEEYTAYCQVGDVVEKERQAKRLLLG